MLPDLPSLKQDIVRALNIYVQKKIREGLGVLNEAPKRTMHEGDRQRVVREDGSVDESPLHRSGTELTLDHEEIPFLTIEARQQKLDVIAAEMARQMSEHMFGTINRVIDERGQSFDNMGQPLSAESIFQMMEKIETDFDEQGNPAQMSVVIPPALASVSKQIISQFETDPVLQKRYLAIIEKKRMAWRDREATRKLVG